MRIGNSPLRSVVILQVKKYDGPARSILIDVGSKDDFLEVQLKPENFAEAAGGNPSVKLQLRMQVHMTHHATFMTVHSYICSSTARLL
jgi:hypothetical protein